MKVSLRERYALAADMKAAEKLLLTLLDFRFESQAVFSEVTRHGVASTA